MGLCDEVRRNAASVAASATSVTVTDAGLESLGDGLVPEQPEPLDPRSHYLEGSEADVATYLLVLDTINFGSGWFPTLRKRGGASGYFTVAWSLADRFRADGPWSNAELRSIRAEEIADVLGQRPDHELMALFAQALRQLGTFLGERGPLDLVRETGGDAERLAELLAANLAMYGADRGFYKRAQIVASDLALAGVAPITGLDRLTIFADNLVPHVLRLAGVLVYDPRLAAHIDAGRLLRPGPQEREIRAGAVQACTLLAQRLQTTERELDAALWNRGQAPEAKAIPRHRCRTVFY